MMDDITRGATDTVAQLVVHPPPPPPGGALVSVSELVVFL